MRRWLVRMMAITVVGTLVGCTSGGGSKAATVTVTAASGTLQHDVSIQVLIK
jgi:ABC-type molybdate transport system substrate-binding protein